MANLQSASEMSSNGVVFSRAIFLSAKKKDTIAGRYTEPIGCSLRSMSLNLKYLLR